MDELKHYGVKGMHWGVRRYQNYDGTRIGATRRLPKPGKPKTGKLTKKERQQEAATNYAVDRMKKKNYSGSSSKEIMDDWGKYKKEYLGKKNGSFTVSKGTEIYRISNANEPIDSKRKYATLDKNDAQEYAGQVDTLSVDLNKEVGQYTYKTKRDITIRKGENVVEDLINQYGNKDYKQLLKDNGLYKNDAYSPAYRDVAKFVNNTIEKHENDIVVNYKKQGYDAIIDPEDSLGGVYTKSPIIILDPKESIELKEYRKLF